MGTACYAASERLGAVTAMSVGVEALALVARFCEHRQVSAGIRITAVPNLAEAIRILAGKGPEPRWRWINTRGDDNDFQPAQGRIPGADADRLLLHVLSGQHAHDSLPSLPGWCLAHTMTSTAHFARFSAAMCTARRHGLGWMIPAYGEVLAVPRPSIPIADDPSGLPHNDTGEMAVKWPDGTGLYFLRGVHFPERCYRRVIGGSLTLNQVAELPNADQRSVALSYLTFAGLLKESRAHLLDIGARGTRLYRVPLPTRIARDRPTGYGEFDYFIHMRDATHPEREFIEWVNPAVGQRGDAELCQAYAFGITREQWMSITEEG